MKNKQFFTGILGAVLVFGLLLATCDSSANGIKDNSTSYTVTFNSNGGSAVVPQTVASSGKATEPQGVTRAGYTLVGWYRDNTSFQNQWNFATDTVTQNITLYARWSANQVGTFTVTFNSNGGSDVSPIIGVNHGDTIGKPAKSCQ